MTPIDVRMQNLPDELTGLLNFRHRQRTVDLLAVAPRRDHPDRLENGDVLRHARLGNAENTLQV